MFIRQYHLSKILANNLDFGTRTAINSLFYINLNNVYILIGCILMLKLDKTKDLARLYYI